MLNENYQNNQNAATHDISVAKIFVTLIFVCFIFKSQLAIPGEDMKYFENPKQAVELVKSMLLSSDWDELSRYYDLKGTDDLDIGDLKSGDFFIRTQRPEAAHPGEFWKYKRPFSPQFDYLSHRCLPDGTTEVTVHIEIDQGGGMIQRGMQNFYLQKSNNGYQLLPRSPRPADIGSAPDTMPTTIQPPSSNK